MPLKPCRVHVSVSASLCLCVCLRVAVSMCLSPCRVCLRVAVSVCVSVRKRTQLGKAALGAASAHVTASGDVDSEDRTTFQDLAISLPPLTPAALVGLLADPKDVGSVPKDVGCVATGDPLVDAAAAAAALAMGVLSAGPPNINATMGVLTDKVSLCVL